jgi:hypothetical protein
MLQSLLIFGPLVCWIGQYLEEQRERAMAAQAVSEERERARQISTKDARIVAQREAFKVGRCRLTLSNPR